MWSATTQRRLAEFRIVTVVTVRKTVATQSVDVGSGEDYYKIIFLWIRSFEIDRAET